MRYLDTLDTPLGTLQIEATERGLCGIWFPSRSVSQGPSPGQNRVITFAKQELSAYFAGDLTTFSVPLEWQGTLFQESVWQALLAVPYGKTVTYGDVAKATADRAVSARRRCSGKTPPHHRTLSPRHRQ